MAKYLPIYPERNWDQTVRGDNYYWPAWEGLPVTNTFLDASRNFSQLARVSNNPVEWSQNVWYWLGNLWGAVLIWPAVDLAGNIWNAVVNGYKRMYNYWANAYNNLVDRYNNSQMWNQQTSTTWRRITPQMYRFPTNEAEREELKREAETQADWDPDYNQHTNMPLRRLEPEEVEAWHTLTTTEIQEIRQQKAIEQQQQRKKQIAQAFAWWQAQWVDFNNPQIKPLVQQLINEYISL